MTLILGLIKGLVRQVVSGSRAVVAGLILAARYYDRVSAVFGRVFNSEKWASIVAFAVVFIVVLLVGSLISFLCRKLVQRTAALRRPSLRRGARDSSRAS